MAGIGDVADEDDDQPSCSKMSIENDSENELFEDDDYDFSLQVPNEAAEIAQLQLQPSDDPNVTTSETNDKPKEEEENDDRIPRIDFKCVSCRMHEMVHYLGQNPPFAEGVQFVEDTYVMRDPFQPAPPRWKQKPEYFVAIGAACIKCAQVVCKDTECSFFYTKTYCLPCATLHIQIFPLEAQAKIRKQVANKQKK